MPTPEQVVAAIRALYRVRAVEKPPDEDGLREIWHHAALGVELFSVVNPEGRLTQQEFTLFNEVFHWSRRGGLRTGRLSLIGGMDPSSGDGKIFDPERSPSRLKHAHEALCAYDGKDNYLVHFRDLLAAAMEGKTFTADRVVSGVRPEDSQEVSLPRIARRLNRRLALAAGAAVLALLVGALWLLLRR